MIAEYVPPPGGDEDVPPPSDGGGGTSPESGPDVPDDTPEPAKAESDGCGCAVPGPPTSLPAPFALVGAAYLLRRGVRRIRQRPQR